MDQQRLRDIMSGRCSGPADAALRGLLRAASVPYAAGMALRRRLHQLGLLHSHAAPAPVISVGNMTTGGTGKTPLVAWVVGQLQNAGRRPAVLIRGYKANQGRSDEAELLKRLTGAVVEVDSDRLAGARRAVAAGVNVLVMDDGFQHLRLRRELDIVLVDASNPFGYGFCLPRGMLREPLRALGEAGAIVITHCELAGPEELARLKGELSRLAPAAAIALAEHEPTGLETPEGVRPVDDLVDRKVHAFCGLGNPEGFLAMLQRYQALLVGSSVFDDHAVYDEPALSGLAAAARTSAAEVLVTTAKDRVKIADANRLPLPLWTLNVRIGIVQGEPRLLEMILAAAGGKSE